MTNDRMIHNFFFTIFFVVSFCFIIMKGPTKKDIKRHTKNLGVNNDCAGCRNYGAVGKQFVHQQTFNNSCENFGVRLLQQAM